MEIFIALVPFFVIWLLSLFLHGSAPLMNVFTSFSLYYFRCALRLARQCIKYQTLEISKWDFLQSRIERYLFMHFNKKLQSFRIVFLISFFLYIYFFFATEH